MYTCRRSPKTDRLFVRSRSQKPRPFSCRRKRGAKAAPLASIFTRPDSPVYELAATGNRFCSLALLFVGLNVFASGMFTALSNGVVSAVLAFSRSFLFTVASIQIMPVLLGGVTGVWLATPAAALLGTAMAAALLLRYRKRYGY